MKRIFMLLSLTLASLPMWGDTVTLKNGDKLTGKVISSEIVSERMS